MKSLEVKVAQARETLNKAVDTAGAFYLRHRTPINIGVSVLAVIALNGVADAATNGYAHVALASGPTVTPTPDAMKTVQKHLGDAVLTPGIPGASATINAAGREIATLQHLAAPTLTPTVISVLASTPVVGPETGPDLLGGIGGLAKQFWDWTWLSNDPWYLKISAWVPIATAGTIVGIGVNERLHPRPNADLVEEMPIQAHTRQSEANRERDAAEARRRVVTRVSEDDPSVFQFILGKCGLRRQDLDMTNVPDGPLYDMCFTEFYHPNEFLFKYTPWSQKITDEVQQALEPVNVRLDKLSAEQLAQGKELNRHDKAILTMARHQLEEMARRYSDVS